MRGPVAFVPREANTGKSGAGGYSIGPDRGKLVEIPPVAGAKRQRRTASDAAGNQEIGRLYFLYSDFGKDPGGSLAWLWSPLEIRK